MNIGNKIVIEINFIVTVLFGVLLLSFAGNASATLSLDYTLDSSNPLASIYYDPTDFRLHGSNIAVTKITGIETTQTNPNSLAVSGGLLNFVTGELIGTTGNIWTFANGGSITVTGGIAPLSIADTSTSLLSGTFDTASVTQMPLYGQLTFGILGATFSAVGSQPIYNYFNIPSDPTSADGINLSFLATSGGTNSSLVSNSIGSGNVISVPTVVATPIPAATWLLGPGLIGLAGLRRRMRG